ncbi:hypothetical protein NQ317_016203 [Molorchus minor]|uniref:Uncharacterized protein n=1 Tax=Molorchus minor TaxID=1323400 RepID=A0ABQ9J7V0_9CUCU|nr:hypothetical protein NQ317_016203 [Molorchus minor]
MDPIVCQGCLELLKSCFNLAAVCENTEEKIKRHIEHHGLVKLDNSSLCKVDFQCTNICDGTVIKEEGNLFENPLGDDNNYIKSEEIDIKDEVVDSPNADLCGTLEHQSGKHGTVRKNLGAEMYKDSTEVKAI